MLMAKATPSFSDIVIRSFRMIDHGNSARTMSNEPEYTTIINVRYVPQFDIA